MMKRMLMMAVVVALTMTVGSTTALAAKKKAKKAKVEQQETWPNGEPMDTWFTAEGKVDVETLGKRYVLTDFGVRQGTEEVQTKQIQAVIDRAAREGGGVVVVPKGTFFSGSLFFKPGTHLLVEEGGVLKGSERIRDFEIRETRIEGQTCKYFTALVNADGVDGFTIAGKGTIDGNGTKIGHEYWLREYEGVASSTSSVVTAAFNYPDAVSGNKEVTNTFLWDYYYNASTGHNRKDANADTYQTYYSESRTLTDYPRLAHGTPYIIGFPGKTYYEFDLSGEWTAKNTATPAPEQLSKQAISFVSEPGITIAVSDNELNAVSEDNYSFVPNYMSKKVEGYLMNATGSSFDKTPDGGLATVPFRPYFVAAPAQNGAPRRAAAESIVFDRTDSSFAIGDDPSDELAGELTFSTKPRKLITTSSLRQPADVRIYNVSGVAISTFTIQPGETIETDITVSGVYIIRAANGRYMKKLALK